jgi:hypothetical protein
MLISRLRQIAFIESSYAPGAKLLSKACIKYQELFNKDLVKNYKLIRLLFNAKLNKVSKFLSAKSVECF